MWLFFVRNGELADSTFQRALTEWELPPVDLWPVYPAGPVATAKAKAFVSFVENLLAETA